MRKQLQRQMSLLSKYYDVDEENKVVTIPLKYEKATDIVDTTLRDKGDYLIDEDAMTELVKKASAIPIIYKIKYSIEIDDYEGYDPNKLLNNINNCIELNHYNQGRERRWNKVLAIFLLVIGVSLIIFNVTAKNAEWYGDIAYETLDIVSWVFIWEATSVAFLRPSELDLNSKRIIRRMYGLELLDSNLNVLATENTFDDNKEWANPPGIEKFAKGLLLYSGAALMVSSIYALINVIYAFVVVVSNPTSETGLALIILSVQIVIYTLTLLAGISAITTYLGRGPFRSKARYLFLFILALLFALETYLIITEGLSSNASTTILLLSSALFYVIGMIISLIIAKKDKKRQKEVKTE